MSLQKQQQLKHDPVEYQIIKQKQSVKNHSIESHFTIYHSASFSIKEEISQSKKKYSKYETCIDNNEENKSIQSTKEMCCS